MYPWNGIAKHYLYKNRFVASLAAVEVVPSVDIAAYLIVAAYLVAVAQISFVKIAVVVDLFLAAQMLVFQPLRLPFVDNPSKAFLVFVA